MVFVWVEQAFVRARDSGRLDAALDAWRERFAVFSGFASLSELVVACRSRYALWEPKNQITIALCALAREGDEDAKLLLTELYMPALREVLREYRGLILEPEDLEAEILTGFWATVPKISPQTPKPPARLRWGAKDRVRRVIKRAWRVAPELPLGDLTDLRSLEHPETMDPAVLYEGVSGASSPEEVLVRARDAGVISLFEAQLIALTRLGDRTLEEAGLELGVQTNPDSLGVARLRAEARVEAWILGRPIPARRKVRRGV